MTWSRGSRHATKKLSWDMIGDFYEADLWQLVSCNEGIMVFIEAGKPATFAPARKLYTYVYIYRVFQEE